MITSARSGNLSLLTVVLGSAIAFFGLVLIFIIAYAGWSGNYSAIDRDKMLVKNALDQSIAQILSEQKSISWWDDAVENISVRFDYDWVNENFGIFLSEMHGHDEIYIFDHNNHPIYGLKNGDLVSEELLERETQIVLPVLKEAQTGERTGLAARIDAFAPQQERYDVLASVVLKCGKWKGHILAIQGRPAVVAGITVCPTVDSRLLDAPRSTLVSVVYIDEAFVTDMGNALLLPDLRFEFAEPTKAGVFAERFVTDDGHDVGNLTWTPRKPGRILLTIILPLVCAGVLGAGILTFFMLRRLGSAYGELAIREAAASHQARHDALSGLPNRHFFAEQLRSAIARIGDGQNPLFVAYIDIDRFKDTNDTLGHHAGDELINAIGRRLTRRLRPGQVLARFGGDEFAVLASLPHEEVSGWVEGAMASFAEPFTVTGQRIRVTASMGIASAPDNGSAPEELMRNADIALYAAKARGRDRAVFFSREMADAVQRRLMIETDLRAAIGSDALSLSYQPIVSCKGRAVVALEALLRWRHPIEGDISPAEFIPVAEEAGLMPDLGAWVLGQAFADAARWPYLETAVNLSPAQFRDLDLKPLLAKLAAKHGVNPSQIVLEVTEGLLLETSGRVKEALESIRDMGFKLALDDFGTGYSSLNYLHSFNFDKLKIDRSFISSLSTANARTIVRTVISLGRSLGMTVVAEGIETEEDAAMMGLFGCAEMQGFLISRALSSEEIDRFLTHNPHSTQYAEATRGNRAAI